MPNISGTLGCCASAAPGIASISREMRISFRTSMRASLLERRQRACRRPPAAGRLEQAARGQQLVQADQYQVVFRGEQRLLGLQNIDEVDGAPAELGFGNIERLARGGDDVVLQLLLT